METRTPAVAGRFYPEDPQTLRKAVEKMLVPAFTPLREVFGVMVPHAGYMFSGGVAGKTFASITPPATAILLGPNHFGMGTPAALWDSGMWATPLGETGVDGNLAKSLARECRRLTPDRQAHYNEHSLEVQVPFLQSINPAMKIVPIMFRLGNLEDLLAIGRMLAGVLKDLSPRPLLVASSDMNHFEPHDLTLEKDGPVLEAILALDPERMWKEVRDGRVSMCGVEPVAVMLEAVRALGATGARLVEHTTSAPVSGDYEKTVGYAGVIAG
jgi:AmmeMemoRadiSam system protein B